MTSRFETQCSADSSALESCRASHDLTIHASTRSVDDADTLGSVHIHRQNRVAKKSRRVHSFLIQLTTTTSFADSLFDYTL